MFSVKNATIATSVHNSQVFRHSLSHRDFPGTGHPIIDTNYFKIQISFSSLQSDTSLFSV